MSLLDDIQVAAGQAIGAVKDLQVSIVIIMQSDPEYDPTSGDVNAGENKIPIDALKTKFTNSEKQIPGYESTDIKFLIYAPDLPIRPTVNDTVLFNESIYKIKDFELDISESILTLFVGL